MYPFHLAFAVRDLEETKRFYREHFGVTIGRETESWVDFDFYGHQLSAHLKPDELTPSKTNTVDGKDVPVTHFGIVLSWEKWHELAERLSARKTPFIIEPYIRFKGKVGEQATMFLLDPSGNAMEFKSFKDESQLFAS